MDIFDTNGLINSDVQDILYELGNVGLGRATITIGKMMGLRMNIGVPTIVPAKNISLKEEEKKVKAGVLMDFQISMKGSIFFLLDEEFINTVIEHLCSAEDIHIEEIDESDRLSALEEFANIIAAAYLKAIGEYTGIRIFVKPVWLKIKPENEMIEEIMHRLDKACQKVINVDTSYSVVYENGTIKENVGRLMMLPDEKSVEKLTKPLLEDF